MSSPTAAASLALATPAVSVAPPSSQSTSPVGGSPGTWFVSQVPPAEPVRPLVLCAPTDEVQLHYLPDVPHFIPTVAKLLYDEWTDIFNNHLNIFDSRGVEESLVKDYSNKTRPNLILVATVNGEFAATGTLASEDAPAFHPYMGVKPWLTYMVCVPAFRRRGIAALIYNKIAELAQRMGYKSIWLITETEQLEAMYAKSGWKSIERLLTWEPRIFTVMRRDFQPVLPKNEKTRTAVTVAREQAVVPPLEAVPAGVPASRSA